MFQIFSKLFSKKKYFQRPTAAFFLFRSDCKDTAKNKYEPNILALFFFLVFNKVINNDVNNFVIIRYIVDIQQITTNKILTTQT